MPDEKKAPLNERISALREKYCLQLPEKFLEIEDRWNEVQSDRTNVASVATFYRLVHTLKGTASTFGFTAQSDTCFKIQKLLIASVENQSILPANSIKPIQTHIYELEANIRTPANDMTDK